MEKAYGAIPSKYDARDYSLSGAILTYPDKCILENMPEAKNQTLVKSCVAHATSSILEYHDGAKHPLSTNFIYGLQKYEFGDTTPGMQVRAACKIVAKYGDMTEADCPGNDEVPFCYGLAEKTLADAEKLKIASNFRIAGYYSCKNHHDIKYAISHHGPVLATLRWYPGFRLNKDAHLIANKKGRRGYHAIVIYGYDTNGFYCQNSWGKQWGKDGCFFISNQDAEFVEAKALVDWVNPDEVKIPERGFWHNLGYSIINHIVNFFWTLFRR